MFYDTNNVYCQISPAELRIHVRGFDLGVCKLFLGSRKHPTKRCSIYYSFLTGWSLKNAEGKVPYPYSLISYF